jgi:hypothetical protein
MVAIRYNPITFSQKLNEAGLSKNIADLHAEELCNILNSDLCTKADIKELELKIYGFIFKAKALIISVLGTIQTILHFLPQ